ncbi:hypothetical protein [Rugamonas aquatica]|uniref:Uncharacterized protein n=1 Tax=Rugamonas aquatica TaxID=2743357 RepID=A0A6A7N674_9BURK|nr:hypothetical protein [Rugamonas aquatica]MQA40550.1 hypothetical protein [Rugamonas aquatica]
MDKISKRTVDNDTYDQLTPSTSFPSPSGAISRHSPAGERPHPGLLTGRSLAQVPSTSRRLLDLLLTPFCYIKEQYQVAMACRSLKRISDGFDEVESVIGVNNTHEVATCATLFVNECLPLYGKNRSMLDKLEPQFSAVLLRLSQFLQKAQQFEECENMRQNYDLIFGVKAS